MALSVQPIPYQGSKRMIAEQIMRHAPHAFSRLVEPFAGSAAMTLFVANRGLTHEYVINDSYQPLTELWKLIILNPQKCINGYEKFWIAQQEDPRAYYAQIRSEFNEDHDPVKFLYLMARCVKNAIRFNSSGGFNQSPDNRRLGRTPTDMSKQILIASTLLKNKTTVMNLDCHEVFQMAKKGDLIYMDPPYQGTSTSKNPRYHQGLDLKKFIESIEYLNNKGIDFLISFDGVCGTKKYGSDLPEHLGLKRVDIHAGRSTTATLHGKQDMTIESLYISPTLTKKVTLPVFSLAVPA